MLIGYARVSTDDQNLDMQVEALKKAGVSEDYIFTDKASGAATKRDGLACALRAVQEGDVLVVWSLDRLARSLKQLIDIMDFLDRNKVGFRAVTGAIDTTTAGGRLIIHVFGAVAEFERALIRERTRAGVAAAKARGVRVGRKLEATPEKIERAKDLIRGGMAFRAAAKEVGLAVSTLYRDIPGGASSLLDEENDVDIPADR